MNKETVSRINTDLYNLRTRCIKDLAINDAGDFIPLMSALFSLVEISVNKALEELPDDQPPVLPDGFAIHRFTNSHGEEKSALYRGRQELFCVPREKEKTILPNLDEHHDFYKEVADK